jgi:carbonic anhydrase
MNCGHLKFCCSIHKIEGITMDRLIKGFEHFRNVTFPQVQPLLKKLASAQAPHTMVITCADSRVAPEFFMSAEPGDIFVCRNVGNIVPPYAQFTGGVSAAIEYAVAVLGVTDIVICGHSDCGAMKATLRPESTAKLNAVSAWLRHSAIAKHVVDENYACCDAHEALHAVTEENVIAQLDHLRTHPSVAAKLARGNLRIHGWVYDIETATIKAYSAEQRKFVPFESAALEFGTTAVPQATPPVRLPAAEDVGGVA